MVASWHARTLSQALVASAAYANDIRRAAQQGAKFVVTQEGGISITARLRSAVLAPLAAVSKQTGVQIIAGLNQSRPAGDLAYSILPDGTEQQYSKRHLVPILEDRFTPGHDSGWLGDGRAMEICKDMDFPDTIRRDAARGVRLMGVPSGDFVKDAWLHGRMAIVRGVEDGFAVVRAANDGLVTASDAEGRLVASKMDQPTGLTMIAVDLPLGPGTTLYARIGDVFGWFCTAFALLIVTYTLYGMKRS